MRSNNSGYRIRQCLRLLCLLLLILTGQFNELAAQPALQLGAQGVLNYPLIADEGNIISLAFYVRNTGNASFNAQIITHQAINANPANPVDTSALVSINPGDSILLTVNGYDFLDPDFVLGRNCVVIWVTDDNLSIISNSDSIEFFLTDGPAFRFGNFGLTGFPFNADTNSQYNFDLHVENYHPDDYFDTLYVHIATNGDTARYPSTGPVWIAGLSSIFYTQSNVQFKIPPYQLGNNEVKIWVSGTEVAMAIDTAVRQLHLSYQLSDDLHNTPDFEAWPNPVDRNALLRLASTQRIEFCEIRAADGRVWMRKTIRDFHAEIDLQHAPCGVYVIRAHLANGSTVRRKLVIR